MAVFNNREARGLFEGWDPLHGGSRKEERGGEQHRGRKTGGTPSIHPAGVISFAVPLISSLRGEKPHSQTCI